MKPITYKPNPDCEGGMEVHRYGKYVSEIEYKKLKSEVDEIKKALNNMNVYGEQMAVHLKGSMGSYPRALADEWFDFKKSINKHIDE